MADKDDLKKMTFSEHFDELRKRLIRCVIAVVVVFVVCFCFKTYLVDMVTKPYEDLRAARAADPEAVQLDKLVFISLPENFLFHLKVCFLIAVFISAPILLYQMWRFIGAGLYRHERAPVMRVMPLSMILYLVGMLFGYYVLFPLGMRFLLDFGEAGKFEASITVNNYFSLLALLILVMGFIFQTPLVMVILTKIGLVTPELFSSKRKYFILGAFVASALFTPPDWVTQCLLAGPLLVLFEIGILLSRGVKRKQEKKETAGRVKGKPAKPIIAKEEDSHE